MKNTRWIAHKELLHISSEIKKAERRIVFILSDIDSFSLGRARGLSSESRTVGLDGLNARLLSEQEKKTKLSDAFFELIGCVPSPPDETIILYYLQGLSVTEISIKRDLSEGTVKNHLSYGRDLIYEKLTGRKNKK